MWELLSIIGSGLWDSGIWLVQPLVEASPQVLLPIPLATSVAMMVIQSVTERVQLRRLKRDEPPLSYYFPGVEFVLAAVGILLGAAVDYAVVAFDLVQAKKLTSASLSVEQAALQNAVLLRLVIITILAYWMLLILEQPPVKNHAPQASVAASPLTPPVESDHISRPSYRRRTFWIGLLVLFVNSAYL